MSYEASLKHKRDAESVFRSVSDIGGEEVLIEDYVKGFKEGYEIGFKYGLEEDKHEKAIEFARTMKQDGIPMAQIMRYTDLSAKEIEKL